MSSSIEKKIRIHKLRHKYKQNEKLVPSSSAVAPVSPGNTLGKKKKKNLHQSNNNENKYLNQLEKLKQTIPNWNDVYCVESEQSRIEQLIRVEVLGKPLCDKYAWAVPDPKSLRILTEFSPLIEIGSGKAYWANLLSKPPFNADIVCFDKYSIEKPWTTVYQGGPEVLKISKIAKGRNLFLCYPDENESMAVECIQYYQGEYIIHVGELIVTGGTLSQIQSPWGRTSTSEFQVLLMEQFHCVLITEIPTFPFSSDHISVWKRTKTVYGKESHFQDEEEEEIEDKEDFPVKDLSKPVDTANKELTVDENEVDDGEEEDEDGDLWRSIPPDEVLHFNIAASAFAHLLS